MGTRYLFQKAIKISQNLSPHDKIRVKNLCNTIRKSQEKLICAADLAMLNCLTKCKGLCCKSLDIDSVFSLWDFIFILMSAPQFKDEMQECLDSYNSMYLSPCPFLKDNTGPCIFPSGIKAQLCVITFCSNDEKIKKYIKVVNLNFYKLCWLIQYLRIKRILQKMLFPVIGCN
ncbi:MAG: hypothetical protein GY860_19415 [Desulfobacteraceae bacterium]|nr:hypothetical protein [Desulfobacteraceae bacterium]